MKKLFIAAALFIILGSVSVNAQQTDSLQHYIGTYTFPDGSVVPDVTVELSDTTLTMSSQAGTSVLIKEGTDLFTIVEFSGTALFKRNDAGMVNAVHIEANGYVLDGTKKGDGTWAWQTIRKPKNALLKD